MKSVITDSGTRSWGRLLLWAGLLNALLLSPQWLRFGFSEPRWIAWEAWVLVGLFALLPDQSWTKLLRWMSVITIMTSLVLGWSDGATHQVLARPLNLYFDINLLSASFHLLDGNFGRTATIGAFVAVGAVLCVLTWLTRTALASRPLKADRIRRALAVATCLALVGALLEARGIRLVPVARTPSLDTLAFQFDQVVQTHRARIEFIDESPAQPTPATAMPGLAETDVLMVFIESYGATMYEREHYRDALLPTLDRMERALATRDLAVVSGFMESPIRGGQSWLSHATTLSGRWINNQLWYQLLLESHANTLIDDFQATGHEAIAVMPAIVMPWPEGRQLGFDQIFEADDLAYRGPPLNWVTMPDQYTLHYFQRTIRPRVRQPLFAQIALISSHAPWTPILEREAWEDIGDGRIFEPWRDAGESPQELWQDIEKVRDHFARSVRYSVHVSLDFAVRHLDDKTLMILLGDHQPATLITGDGATSGVPVHVIARQPGLLAPFVRKGFQHGLVPPNPASAPRLTELRGWMHEAFGSREPLDNDARSAFQSEKP